MQLYNGHHHLGMFVNFGGTLITVVIQGVKNHLIMMIQMTQQVIL